MPTDVVMVYNEKNKQLSFGSNYKYIFRFQINLFLDKILETQPIPS